MKCFACCVVVMLGARALFAAEPVWRVAERLDLEPVPSAFPVGFSLLTRGGRQYAAYYDANHQMTVAARKLGERKWQLVKLDSKVGWDSHNYVTMAIDSAGCIHLSGNMHCVPLVYFRTDKPGDIATFRAAGDDGREGTAVHVSQVPVRQGGPAGLQLSRRRQRQRAAVLERLRRGGADVVAADGHADVRGRGQAQRVPDGAGARPGRAVPHHLGLARDAGLRDEQQSLVRAERRPGALADRGRQAADAADDAGDRRADRRSRAGWRGDDQRRRAAGVRRRSQADDRVSQVRRGREHADLRRAVQGRALDAACDHGVGTSR